ncbi:hypothetical protein L0244_23310 [bacterium]|nr:hypothetical protein [bacterium]
MSNHPEHYAIVIAVETYLHLPAARTAIKSAKSFAEWLKDENGGGLPEANLGMFLSPLNLQKDLFDLWNSEIKETGKKGTRLYFYFSGLASGQTFDTIVMLTFDASIYRLNGFSLTGCREFFQKTGAFEEVIYILDSPRVPVMNTGSSFSKTFEIPSDIYTRVTDFVLVAGSLSASFKQESSNVGHLTGAVLEGLKGKASDPFGRVTAVSLSQYVQSHPGTLSTAQGLPEALLPTQETILATVSIQRERGTLVIELPHQFASLRIYDNLLRYVGRIGPAVEDQTQPGRFTKQMDLPPGIYKVEAYLEDQSDAQFVSILPNSVSRIEKSKWKEFKLTTSAPLLGTTTADDSHINPAVEWSRKLTWSHKTGGNSRLFIFVRTVETGGDDKDFTGGLRLLDEREKLIVDIQSGGQLNVKEGWMAFCSDLPPGFYILRRGKRGISICHLPVYLCLGYETQIFLKIKDPGSLPALSINMAPYGRGFQANDETAAAADAVLYGMKYGLSGRQIVTSEKISTLIRQKLENPWLGILAAYVLSPSDTLRSSRRLSNIDPDISDLYNDAMNYLITTIPDHPDARALRLETDKPPDKPFLHPPLLRQGLSLVRQNAIKYADTIPAGSLTDRVLSAEYVNSPWTNWGNLQPTESVKKSIRKQGTQTGEFNLFSQSARTTSYLQSIAPKLPVFELPEIPKDSSAVPQPAEESMQPEMPVVSSLRDAEMIHVAQELTKTHDLDTIPESVVLSPTNDLKNLIESIRPEEISSASGQPLSRILDSLEKLRKKNEEIPESLVEAGQVPLTSGELAIVEFALLKSARTHKEAVLSSYAVEKQSAEASADLPPSCFVSIEDLAGKLNTEADSLVRSCDDGSIPDEDRNTVKQLADRIRAIGQKIQQQAAITIISDRNGRIMRTNGIFISIISATGNELNTEIGYHQLRANQSAWESALPSMPIGTSSFENPIPGLTPQTFKLRRTEIRDQASKEVVAYLNVLRGKDVPGLRQKKLEQIDSTLSDLQVYASIYVYHSSGNREMHFVGLQKCVEQLEEIISKQTDS